MMEAVYTAYDMRVALITGLIIGTVWGFLAVAAGISYRLGRSDTAAADTERDDW